MNVHFEDCLIIFRLPYPSQFSTSDLQTNFLWFNIKQRLTFKVCFCFGWYFYENALVEQKYNLIHKKRAVQKKIK